MFANPFDKRTAGRLCCRAMKNKMNKEITAADRIAALVAFINEEDVRQGRPADVEPRTAADLNARIAPCIGGRIVLADVDNHVFNQSFAVLTIEEAATAKELCLERDLTEADCVSLNGQTYVVVSLS